MTPKVTKVLISGGGTGGHIYPAIAIAQACKKELEAEILFVGALGKMEMEKVPKAGFSIVGLPIAGFNRSKLWLNVGLPFKLVNSLFQAWKVLKSFKPDVAIGVGGYASGPTLFIASLLGIPYIIQEQNSYAGVTNKLLSKKAKRICVAYPNMEKFFPVGKIAFTGNPVREDLIDLKTDKEEALAHFGLDVSKKTILVIGGSQGARSINQAVYEGIGRFAEKNIQFIWQTGKNYKAEAHGNYISEFLYEMDKAYVAADLVISRAGALSVSELSLAAKPTIFVPFPFAAEDHQTQNALSLVHQNAAVLVLDHLAGKELVSKALELITDPKKLQTLASNIAKMARPKATELIVNEIKAVVK